MFVELVLNLKEATKRYVNALAIADIPQYLFKTGKHALLANEVPISLQFSFCNYFVKFQSKQSSKIIVLLPTFDEKKKRFVYLFITFRPLLLTR